LLFVEKTNRKKQPFNLLCEQNRRKMKKHQNHKNHLFSGSQKKKLMKEKRARQRGEKVDPVKSNKSNNNNNNTSGKEGEAKAKNKNTSTKNSNNNKRGVRVIKEIYGLKTVFAREDDEIVAQRKLLAQKPFSVLRTEDDSWRNEDLRPMHILGMPKRPAWDETTTKEALEKAESQAFATWIKEVYGAADQVKEQGQLNFFEHNLEVWRQLWRSLEMGDCVLICADVRWPTFTFPYALMEYCRELKKAVILTLTKTDLVDAAVAEAWGVYFKARYPELTVALTHSFPVVELEEGELRVKAKCQQRVKALKKSPETKAAIIDACRQALNWEETRGDRPYFTISAVGAPNAGKSAIINLLVEAHKVAVSATPGKTKHFQTHFVEADVRLCDSPGLMFPSISDKNSVSSRVMQSIVGNYPVPQVREPFSAVAFLAARVDLPKIYGLSYPYDEEYDDKTTAPYRMDKNDGSSSKEEREEEHAWTSFQICEALAKQRGFMFKGGNYDVYRSGKSILSESLKGILKPIYWLPPQ
jgi:ribosome biogenesis GTPase A